ncbi:hypothetical protein NY2A_b483L [Paramecium bursaria Chlorella virus NY2A]|uniref:Uncharacterized protein b483L n=1 Tax=Paramecium bursaria Chlorella virus NY2A TaxID=46021 RepID=A7IX08_PBCVN|nr:hypothetical protein NY2A_b483L [Paramecium bursaria Chlorella virus NY2A]ABT14882.1 hypothetical protein NY2A_b483L [Paramecium bursaria Chlorella virus NY2A]
MDFLQNQHLETSSHSRMERNSTTCLSLAVDPQWCGQMVYGNSEGVEIIIHVEESDTINPGRFKSCGNEIRS